MNRKEELAKATRWIYETIILFGGSEHTTHLCAGYFNKGILEEWERDKART